MLGSNLREAGAGQSLNEAFERLIFQRTADIIAHQRMLQEANAKLENLANTDPLTGLFNRRRFPGSSAIRSRPGAPLRDGFLDDDRLELVQAPERPVWAQRRGRSPQDRRRASQIPLPVYEYLRASAEMSLP